jgi:DNA-binding SARP family transcriptional activator
MEFLILGPLEVRAEGRLVPLRGSRQRALLAVLLLHAGEAVSTDRLIDLVWPDAPPDGARKALSVRMSRLRKALEQAGGAGSAIVTRAPGYAIEVGSEEFDLLRFEDLSAAGARAFDAGDARTASTTLRAGLDLWRGPPLADFAFEPFAQADIPRLEELRIAALENRIEADLELGRHATLIGELEGLVVGHPFRERLHGQLMLALYRCGRQAEALEAYRTARRVLVEGVGIEPGRELRELEQALLRQEAALDAPQPSEARPGAEPGPASNFVGRERELEELLGALADARAGHGRLALVGGEPGVGKSRLAEELARHAEALGVRVLFGRCWEAGGAPAYWPWVQFLRAYIRERDPVALREELGIGAAELSQLLPELGELLPGSLEPERGGGKEIAFACSMRSSACFATPHGPNRYW